MIFQRHSYVSDNKVTSVSGLTIDTVRHKLIVVSRVPVTGNLAIESPVPAVCTMIALIQYYTASWVG